MTISNNRPLFTFALIVTVVASSVALAGDVEVEGSGDRTLEVVNTYTGSEHRYSVHGSLENVAGKGYGGYFTGGYAGVRGNADKTGGGTRYGVIGVASGGSANRGVYGGAPTGSNSYAGFFEGDVFTTGEYEPSDEDLKDEIFDLDGSLDQIMGLKPISFRYRTEEYTEMNLPEGYHPGLLAQEVERVIPNLIKEFTVPEDDDTGNISNNPKTFLALNYVKLIPVLIGAIQEQQEQIGELQYQVAGCGCR